MLKLLISGLILLLIPTIVYAPVYKNKRLYVRITAYSPKQYRESSINHKGKLVRNEVGVAIPKGLLPDGTKIRLPNGEIRKVDDRIPRKSYRKFKGKHIDVRYFQSVTKRGIKKQLYKKDMGWNYVEILD